jgi:hypothetical protein
MKRALRLPGECLLAALMIAVASLLAAREAAAEPYLAVQNGYKCVTCHVNPSGGGLRTDFGVIFSGNVLPATSLPGNFPAWTGKIASFLRMGGDLRASWSQSKVPGNPTQHQHQLDQLRLYADVELIPGRLGIYVDEKVAPGDRQEMEGYIRLNDASHGWYLKAGKFYLPFGWRLQDQTAFVRELSGISMTTPDTGAELGIETGSWSAQLDYSNDINNAGARSRHQLTGQLVWVQPRYRLGAALSQVSADTGDRSSTGLFAGMRTGSVAWLGELDLVHDDGFADGSRALLAAFGELDWAVRRGHNLKLTAEIQDPDRAVPQDQFTRWSIVYEYTPLAFLQLRAGFRRYRGIPQNDFENRQTIFVELHGYL